MLREQAEANLRLAETLTEQSKKQADTLRILPRESTEAWTNLLVSPVSSSGAATDAAEGSAHHTA